MEHDPTDFIREPMVPSDKISDEHPKVESKPQTFETQVEEAVQAQALADAEPRQPIYQSAPAAVAGAAVTQLQKVQTQAAQAFRPLTNTVWSKLDRKATAVTEFTLRQYRTKNSTWVVLGIGMVIVAMLLMY